LGIRWKEVAVSTKIADSKGRVALGPRFANQTVLVEEVDPTEVRITIAAVVPQRELWLRQNRAAQDSVLRGLAQARSGKFSKTPPNLDQDAAIAERLDD
jgi:hypothetical protein